MQPVRILEELVGGLQVLTAQDSSDLQGAIVYDWRPQLLPVSLRLKDIGVLPLTRTVASASLAAPPQADIGGVSPEGVAIPELGVTPQVDPSTELEDELPMPDDSPLFHDSSPEGVCPPGACSAPRDLVDLELEKALLSVSILPDEIDLMSVDEPTDPVCMRVQHEGIV